MTSPPSKPPGRVAGIDYGSVRIGIALSDSRRTTSGPFAVYTRQGEEADARYFRRLAEQEQITLFVVGLPAHLSGRESQKSREARDFGRRLKEITGREVVFFDERYTTAEATQHLIDADMSRAKRKRRVDKLAAQILLAAYLESGKTDTDDPGPLDDR